MRPDAFRRGALLLLLASGVQLVFALTLRAVAQDAPSHVAAQRETPPGDWYERLRANTDWRLQRDPGPTTVVPERRVPPESDPPAPVEPGEAPRSAPQPSSLLLLMLGACAVMACIRYENGKISLF